MTPHATRNRSTASAVRARAGVRAVTGEQREDGEGEEPREVEVEPVRQHELEGRDQRRGQRRELQRRLPARNERCGERTGEHERLHDLVRKVEVRYAARVVLPPVPDREWRLAPELPAERSVPERARGFEHVRLEEEHREREHRAREVAEEIAHDSPRVPLRIGRPQRRDRERCELRPAGERGEAAPQRRLGREEEADDEQRRKNRVVRVRARRVLRERIRRPRERERRSEALSAEAPADECEPEYAEDVERDRGEVRGGKVVPLAGPAEQQVARDVGEVGHRAVRVAAVVRGLAAPVRLHALADLPLRVGRSACLEISLDRHVAVRRLTVDDAVGADHTRVADVDHGGALDVQPDAKAGEEDRARDQHPDRPGRTGGLESSSGADPGHARDHVEKRRVRERDAREDVASVEEPERDREREQREQIEVPQRERTTEVGEPDEEEQAEAEPDERLVDVAAAEGAWAAARHLPRDLRAGPGLGHETRAVFDPSVGDLAGLAPPHLDPPHAVLVVELGLHRSALPRVALQPVPDLGVGEEEALRTLLAQTRGLGRGDERRLDEVPLAVEDGARLGGCRRRLARRDQREGDEPVCEEALQRFLRNVQSLLPTKLIGVTSTIAIACAAISGRPSAIRSSSATRFATSASTATKKKRAPWYATCPRSPWNVHSRFHV